MKTTCKQCVHFGTKPCKNVSESDGACSAFEEKEKEKDDGRKN